MISPQLPPVEQLNVAERASTVSIQLPPFEAGKLLVRAQLRLQPSSGSRRVGILDYFFWEGKEPLFLSPVEIEKLPRYALNMEVGPRADYSDLANTNGKATQKLPQLSIDPSEKRKFLISSKQAIVFSKESFSLYQLRLIVDTLNGSPSELSNPNYYRVKALPEKKLRQAALANSSISLINSTIDLSAQFHNRVMSGYDDLLRPILAAHDLMHKRFERYLQENLLTSGLVIAKIENNQTAAVQNVRKGDSFLFSGKLPLARRATAIRGRSQLKLTYNPENSSLILKNEGQIGCFVIIESINHPPNDP